MMMFVFRKDCHHVVSVFIADFIGCWFLFLFIMLSLFLAFFTRGGRVCGERDRDKVQLGKT